MSSDEEEEEHNVFTFKDERPLPDSVYTYPSGLRESAIPLVIDNGKTQSSLSLSCYCMFFNPYFVFFQFMLLRVFARCDDENSYITRMIKKFLSQI